jgi:NADPH:quinone reductase-like Zn-dependent oxidoreductase
MYEETPQPQPKQGEVLVHVRATGVTPTELSWSTTWKTESGADRPWPIIPGHDLSGEIAALGPGVNDFKIGSEVYGLTDFRRNGAEAEYAIALPSEIALKPRNIDHIQAASVPLAALTAWQALFIHAGLSKGQTVLIHGVAGGVGSYAAQMAHWAGAHVIGTASNRHKEFLRHVGVDEMIDYTTRRFEEDAGKVDIVLDAVGGEALERSFAVLHKGGVLVSVAGAPAPEQAAAHEVRAVSFIVSPDSRQLTQIAELIDAGQIKRAIYAILPLEQAAEAYQRGLAGHLQGRIVLQVADRSS